MEGIGLLGLTWVEYADLKGPRGGIMGRRGELDLTWVGYADPNGPPGSNNGKGIPVYA